MLAGVTFASLEKESKPDNKRLDLNEELISSLASTHYFPFLSLLPPHPKPLAMPSSTLLSLALLASTSFALPTLTTPPSSSAASPSPSSLASFTCTPFDFSQTNNFGGSSPNTFLADLLSFSLDTNQVVVVGFDPSSPNSTLGQVAETAQGNGSWGFEVCTGFEGIDTSR